MKSRDLIYKVTHSQAWQRFLAWFAGCFIRLNYRSQRWTFINRDIIESYIHKKQPAIFCFWHGRMVMLPKAWQWKNPFYMLLSHHADGRLIAQVIHYFGIKAIYGSTRRRGEQAMRDIISALQQGAYIGITPDGPRGPGYEASLGIIKIAALAGVDIIPMTYATAHKKILRTWDKFFIPLPFGKGCFICGAPLKIDNHSPESLDYYRRELTKSLNAITHQADQFCALGS